MNLGEIYDKQKAKNSNEERNRKNYLRRIKYLVAIPLFLATTLTPLNKSDSIDREYKLPNLTDSYTEHSSITNSRGIDKIFGEDLPKYRLMPSIELKVNELLTQSAKKDLENAIHNLSEYSDVIVDESVRTGLDINFVMAYLAQESRGDIKGISHKGAAGLGGLMINTAKEVGLRVDKYVDERIGPQSIKGSMSYMKGCIEGFGDHIIGLIAYNAGPTWTQKNIENIKKIQDITKNPIIPEESREYVVQVIAKTKIISNAELYDFQIKKKPVASRKIREKYTTENPTTTKEIAKRYNITVNELKILNPSLKSDWVPRNVTINIPY